jgi:hypothetical protein
MRMKLPSQLSTTDLLLPRRLLPSRQLEANVTVLRSNKPLAVVFVPINALVTKTIALEADNKDRTEDDSDGRTMIRFVCRFCVFRSDLRRIKLTFSFCQ